jgi:radical SAM superfamily enzyme YgiQ (UPF0313 family)
MPDILFLNPSLTMEERYGKFAKSGTQTPPLGLCNLAAMTTQAGYSTEILDASALNLNCEATVAKVLEVNPKYLGITAVTIAICNAARIGQLIKQQNGDIKIIIGGPHFTSTPFETMKRFESFDIGVDGEGDLTIVELLNALEGEGDLTKVQGLVLRQNGQLVHTGMRPFIKDLDTLPMPRWELLPDLTKTYSTPTFTFGNTPGTSLVTTRGCFGKCIFCDRKVFGNKIRGYSTQYIIDMILKLYRDYGIRDVIIHDDCFVVLKKRLREFCQTLIDLNLDLTWSCNARVDVVNPETLRLMKKSGCWQIGYGIESGSQRILDILRKDITLGQIEQAVRWTREAGIRVRGFFMIGNPGETVESVRETLEFAKKVGVNDFQITMFTPLPGTEIYKNAEKYGQFDNDWAKMNMWEPVFVPNGMSKKELISLQKMVFNKFYFRPIVVWSYLKELKSWGHLKKAFKGFCTLLKGVFNAD